jgi:hypothetical protein
MGQEAHLTRREFETALTWKEPAPAWNAGAYRKIRQFHLGRNLTSGPVELSLASDQFI